MSPSAEPSQGEGSVADPKMHVNELDVDADLVRRLLRAQFP